MDGPAKTHYLCVSYGFNRHMNQAQTNVQELKNSEQYSEQIPVKQLGKLAGILGLIKHEWLSGQDTKHCSKPWIWNEE